jgi:PmbA protein
MRGPSWATSPGDPNYSGRQMTRPPNKGLISEPDIDRAVELALEHAAQLGVAQAEAGVSSSEGLGVTVRLGDVETIEFNLDQSFGVTVFRDGRKGAASTSQLTEEAIREAVAKANSIASLTEPDPASGLADVELMASAPLELDLDHAWALDADAAIGLARRCEDSARAEDPRISNSEGATVSTSRSVRRYGNSHGFRATSASSSHSMGCVVIAEAEGQMERDHWYDVDRHPDGLEAAEKIGRIAAQRTVSRLGGRPITTRHAPVLFPADLACGLLRNLLSAIRGRAQYQEASFLLGAAGTAILPAHVNIDERPHLQRGLGSSWCDAEGVATQERRLIDAGVLTGYLLSSYSARRLGLLTTGHAGRTHNLEISHTHADQTALMREMGDGLLVTELMGHGVNAVTGDYSQGAAGFLVERGEISHPVNQVTIAGRLQDMFLGLVGIGADIETRSALRCGSVLIEDMTIAGD